MGTGRTKSRPKAHAKLKKYKRGHDTKRRGRDLDQIQDDMEKTNADGIPSIAKVAFDDDLPGGGQFYVWETGKHFQSLGASKAHKKSRMFKRRLKELKEEKYSQSVAEAAAGKSKELLPPAHPPRSVRMKVEAIADTSWLS
jgi:bud site selection protein 20